MPQRARPGDRPAVGVAASPAAPPRTAPSTLFFRVEGEPDSRALALRLLHEANVGLAPGSAFGPGGEGHLRLCFAGSVERLQTAMDRLLPALS